MYNDKYYGIPKLRIILIICMMNSWNLTQNQCDVKHLYVNMTLNAK